jgi:hypothetical protein
VPKFSRKVRTMRSPQFMSNSSQEKLLKNVKDSYPKIIESEFSFLEEGEINLFIFQLATYFIDKNPDLKKKIYKSSTFLKWIIVEVEKKKALMNSFFMRKEKEIVLEKMTKAGREEPIVIFYKGNGEYVARYETNDKKVVMNFDDDLNSRYKISFLSMIDWECLKWVEIFSNSVWDKKFEERMKDYFK